MFNPAQTPERIELAYTKLGLREPFIAAVMTRVKREVSDTVPTAATNGTWCRYNPEFCAKWSDEQLFGLVLHESCHVVLMHMWRREGRDASLWNLANDAIINAYIKARGYQLPDGGVHIGWVQETHSSEQVYEKLKQQQEKDKQKQQSKQQGGKGQAKPGDSDGDGADQPQDAGGFDGTGDLVDAVDEATATDMEATIAAAAATARECGQSSSLIDRILSKLGQPKVRWQDVLRSMITEASASDYTYQRPNRRFIGTGLYMPSLHAQDQMGGLVVGFDTSGSITQRDADRIATELNAIVSDLQPEFVEVVYCTDRVTGTQRFDRDDPIDLRPKGTGGTRFKPVFDHVAQMDDRVIGMVYFSDLEGNLDEIPRPEYPVIWANIGQREYNTPFGTAVMVPL
jgi:predicted metal-dependent peptidase